MSTSALELVPQRAADIANEHKLPATTAANIWTAFAPHFKRFDELKASAAAVKPGNVKIARSIRLEVKSVRTAAEKTRKELKEDSLRTGKAIDAFNNILILDLKPVEDALEEIEKAEERAEAARKDKLKAERTAALEPYTSTDFFDLANMPEPEWQKLLATSKAAHETRLAQQEQARAKREAAERAAEEERKRIEQEQAADRERLRAENQRLAAIAQKEREAREQAEQAAKAEADAREAAAKAAKAEADRVAAIERAKREAAEAELKASREAEARRLREEQEAARKAAAAPDAEKLLAVAAKLRSFELPAVSTDQAKAISVEVTNDLNGLADWIGDQLSNL